MVEKYIIRQAMDTDCMSVFQLSNDPVVRKCSIHPEQIEWNSHQKWFVKQIHNADTLFYIAETPEHDFIGQIRFSKDNDCWLVSISIAEKYRYHHLGADILQRL